MSADLFFWICLTFVLIAAFVDWLLRPHERRKVKTAVYVFWASIRQRTLLDAVHYFVGGMLALFKTLQHTWLPSKRYIISCVFAAAIIVPVIVYHVLFTPSMRRFYDMNSNFVLGVTLPYLLFTLLFCFVSLVITIFFLGRMLKARSLQRIAALSALDIASAFLVGYASYAFAYFFAQWFTDIFLRLLGWHIEVPLQKYWINVVGVSRGFLIEADVGSVTAVMLLFSFLPSVVYFLAVMMGIVLFALETPLRPLSLRFCEALLRSEKGVITVVAGGVGVAAKSIQELIKAVGAS